MTISSAAFDATRMGGLVKEYKLSYARVREITLIMLIGEGQLPVSC